eukprot:CAMPEP_0176502072 /NCGR_PEP_ID=MMETSP0200_2-20121128/14541_1 /TAXON_ID=947934 /ORGANISM="Chaetoceros sp., Strain GSL56" /LENGTH=599 /DNA_ID=CAMNT_0017901085 /DNA_START=355 /DNA_END=2155 /DNA_ORIENTATION=+
MTISRDRSSNTNIDDTTTAKNTSSPKRLFAECALVEIIHLHDCLRGAMRQIQKDVNSLVLTASVIEDDPEYITDIQKLKDYPAAYANNDTQPTSLKFDIEKANDLSNNVASRFHLIWSVFQAHSGAEDEFIWPALKTKIESKKRSGNAAGTGGSTQSSTIPVHCGCESHLEQESYEEDHEMEETMFKQINTNLRRLNGSFRYYHANPHPAALCIIKKVINLLSDQTDHLTKHLEEHLEKEETHCLPMVQKHMTNDEISTLVGQIMGKRSAEMMGKILNLAVCSLPTDEREDMVKCLKKAMGGTFFEKWLTMGGWDSTSMIDTQQQQNDSKQDGKVRSNSEDSESSQNVLQSGSKRKRAGGTVEQHANKNVYFQGHITDRRMRHPSKYYIMENGECKLIWNSSEAKCTSEDSEIEIPQFAQSELTPTFHFCESKGKMVHGCEHYSRSCKLRHPATGQLFTCRLCCEEVRSSNKYAYGSIPVLDRQAVKEILCMKCGSLQPAGPKCVNPDCESEGGRFAKYFCSICNLYDDDEQKRFITALTAIFAERAKDLVLILDTVCVAMLALISMNMIPMFVYRNDYRVIVLYATNPCLNPRNPLEV